MPSGAKYSSMKQLQLPRTKTLRNKWLRKRLKKRVTTLMMKKSKKRNN